MSELMNEIKDRYLNSGDFNGLYLDRESAHLIPAAMELVRNGSVQVVGEQDYPNPHIRPWPSRRTEADQIESLQRLTEESYGVCLYPTPAALTSEDIDTVPGDEPYRRLLAAGRGTLELAYFEFDVLESYRNDPRFNFEFRDFGADTIVSDEVYSDETASEKDKIIMGHIGYAYDLSKYDPEDPATPIIRRVCAFLGDLAKLHSAHQLRWKTFQVEEPSTLKPHPMWWAQQMGNWADGLGPFERFFFELETWNELHVNIYDKPLLRSVERPREFGWMLRPSGREFDSFILQLDHLLSDNLLHKALDDMGARKIDDDGNTVGTLGRLHHALAIRHVREDDIEDVIKPLRLVRKLRQKPAHRPEPNRIDSSLLHQQVSLLKQVTESLIMLRGFWQTHKKNQAWQEPSYVSSGNNYIL
jgi:hypothetical protein